MIDLTYYRARPGAYAVDDLAIVREGAGWIVRDRFGQVLHRERTAGDAVAWAIAAEEVEA